jgi:hypothetical protein
VKDAIVASAIVVVLIVVFWLTRGGGGMHGSVNDPEQEDSLRRFAPRIGEEREDREHEVE